tara:strand:+ start:720 stop:968 length:249 start_codon:yes stop_codon:yes gene_type:complete
LPFVNGNVNQWHTKVKVLAKEQKKEERSMAAKRGLYANIHAKRKRIAAGSGEKMRKPGSKGAPTAANFRRSALTAKKPRGKK